MGLLDDLFGKEEINQLKKQLIEKTNEVTRLETSLSTLTNSQLAFDQQVTELNKAVAAGSVSHKTLTMELAQSQSEIGRQATEFDAFKRTTAGQKAQTSATITELQKAVAAFAPELAAAKSERDAKARRRCRGKGIPSSEVHKWAGADGLPSLQK